MIGVELNVNAVAAMPGFQQNPDRSPSLTVVDRCQEAGLLLVPSGASRVRWLPPLNVSRSEIGQAVDIFAGVLHRMASH